MAKGRISKEKLRSSLLNAASAGQQRVGSAVALAEVPRADQMSLVKTVVLLVMFAVAFVANTATLVRMYRMRRRRSTINLLITHLAAADLIVTFFCNVTDAVWTSAVQWYAGNVACKLIKFLQVTVGFLRHFIQLLYVNAT